MERAMKEPISQGTETKRQGGKEAMAQSDTLEAIKREIVATHNRAKASNEDPREALAPLVLEFIEKGGDPDQLVEKKILGVENPLW